MSAAAGTGGRPDLLRTFAGGGAHAAGHSYRRRFSSRFRRNRMRTDRVRVAGGFGGAAFDRSGLSGAGQDRCDGSGWPSADAACCRRTDRAALLAACSEFGDVWALERGGCFGKIKEKYFFLAKKFGFGEILATFALAMPL